MCMYRWQSIVLDTCEEYKMFKTPIKCRFCKVQLTNISPQDFPAFQDLCQGLKCYELSEESCDKIHSECNHACCGFKNEQICLPCLNSDCVKSDPNKTLGCNGNDNCLMCGTELDSKHCIQLECKHIFHLGCVNERVKLRWNDSINGINFKYLECPTCKQEMSTSQNKELNKILERHLQFKELTKKKMLLRAEKEKLNQDPLFTDPIKELEVDQVCQGGQCCPLFIENILNGLNFKFGCSICKWNINVKVKEGDSNLKIVEDNNQRGDNSDEESQEDYEDEEEDDEEGEDEEGENEEDEYIYEYDDEDEESENKMKFSTVEETERQNENSNSINQLSISISSCIFQDQ
ncbi:myc binding protein 2 [Stylonychia lemnae]|uniref:Myc binding protein 2 n=1 Tax=Stylonychia lemnae TaxID=5949 RepID=A0A078AQS1_STYLE|nr:myc binding protein 2 [Stylonychia lemnae]|eukprot:CDW84276.1 myc binding protein 2 [Stylonychia lemnae]